MQQRNSGAMLIEVKGKDKKHRYPLFSKRLFEEFRSYYRECHPKTNRF